MGLKHRHDYESLAAQLQSEEKTYVDYSVAGKLNVALVYPNLYSLGMSNLGFLTVHRLTASVPGVGVERFFPALAPGEPLVPPFYSFETRRPLADFDVLMFSFSYEGDFDKIPGIFSALGLPVHSSRRHKMHPLLIAGGAAVASNSRALSNIFDLLVEGEAEGTVIPMLEQLLDMGADMSRLAALPGVWVPSHTKGFNKVEHSHDINSGPAYSHIVAPGNAFGGAHIIEVMRGCPRICAFCLARCIYAPVRALRAQVFAQWLDKFDDCTSLGLVAPSLFDHPQIDDIFAQLAEKQIRIRNSSVKWEKLDDSVLSLMRVSGTKGLTLAPETGSATLRQAMGKPLDERRFLDKVRMIYEHGFEHIKYYFIIGLPGETADDIKATVDFVGRICAVSPSISSVSLAFSVFVPKNKTEWQDEPVLEGSDLKRRIKLLRQSLSTKVSKQLKFSIESPNEVARQAWLSKVGPELADEYDREAKACKENRLFSKNQFSALEF